MFPHSPIPTRELIGFLSQQGKRPPVWVGPFNPFNTEPLCQFRESEQQTVEERAMPAEKSLAGISRRFKPLSQQKQSILFQHFHGSP
jgi:hypothetical protein